MPTADHGVESRGAGAPRRAQQGEHSQAFPQPWSVGCELPWQVAEHAPDPQSTTTSKQDEDRPHAIEHAAKPQST